MYGNPRRIPVTERDPVQPDCHYGISKHTPEHYLRLYQKLYGLDYVVLRYPNVYGPRQDPGGEAGVIAIFLGLMKAGKTPTIYGTGLEARDYVYVGDIARANVKALERGTNEIICLGSRKSTTTRQIYEFCAAAVGFEGEPALSLLRPGEINRISLASAKAGKLLRWRASTPVAAGIKRTAKAMK